MQIWNTTPKLHKKLEITVYLLLLSVAFYCFLNRIAFTFMQIWSFIPNLHKSKGVYHARTLL